MVFDLKGFEVDVSNDRQTMIFTPDGDSHTRTNDLLTNGVAGALFWLTPDSSVWQNHTNLVLSMNSGSKFPPPSPRFVFKCSYAPIFTNVTT